MAGRRGFLNEENKRKPYPKATGDAKMSQKLVGDGDYQPDASTHNGVLERRAASAGQRMEKPPERARSSLAVLIGNHGRYLRDHEQSKGVCHARGVLRAHVCAKEHCMTTLGVSNAVVQKAG